MLESDVIARPALAVLTQGWAGLDRIAEPGVNVACLRRDVLPSAELSQWMREVATDIVFSWEGSPLQCPTEMLVAALPAPARAQLGADLEMLLPRFARWTRRNHVRVQLSQVRDDACRKFHVDFIGLRTLITYIGQGTEWVESQHARRDQVGRHDLSLEDANAAVVPDMMKVRHARAGDVLVLKGEAFEGNRGLGAIHRSPPWRQGEGRLVLRVDVPQCGC